MSFILRTIPKKGEHTGKLDENIEINKLLGNEYEFIHRDWNKETFRKSYKKYFEKEHVADGSESSDIHSQMVYAFIINQDLEVRPLYKNHFNYIMTETGKTFANLTFKDKDFQ